jgi:autotransporter-associated beta strand protein
LIDPEPHIIDNDFDAGTEFGSIIFSGAGYQLSGNSFADSDGIQLDDVTLTIDVGTGATMQIDGSYSGTGEIVKTGAGELILYGTGYYGLDTTVENGKLRMGRIGTAGQRVSTVEVQADARLEAAGVFADTLNVAAGGKLSIRPLLADPLPPPLPQAPSPPSPAVDVGALAADTLANGVAESESSLVEESISTADANPIPLNDSPIVSVTEVVVPTSPYKEKTVIYPVAAVRSSPAKLIDKPLDPATSGRIYDLLFIQAEKLISPSAALLISAPNVSNGNLPVLESEKTRKTMAQLNNIHWQDALLSQTVLSHETARDSVLRQASGDDWRADWDWIDGWEKKVKSGVKN